MSRKDDISGKNKLMGNRVSHSHRKTRHAQKLNLQTKTFQIPGTSRSITLKITTGMLKTIEKKGLYQTLKKYGKEALIR